MLSFTKLNHNSQQIFDRPWKGMPARRLDSRPGSQDAGASVVADGFDGDKPPNHLFSAVKHYPPAWQVKLKKEAADASTVASENP
jgi:hypothetical protein